MSGTTGTPRSQSDLLTTRFQDGQPPGSISSQDMRDLIVSVSPVAIVIASAGSAQTLTATGVLTAYKVTLNSSNCVLTLAGGIAGSVSTIRLFLTQDATGGRGVTFPVSVVGLDGGVPTLSTLPGQISGFDLTTVDGGTTWLCTYLGLDAGAFTQTQGDARWVRTVNATAPDGSGNVAVSGGSGGGGLGEIDMGPLKGLTIDPRFCSIDRLLVAGKLYCVKARVQPSVSITSILYYVDVAAATPSNVFWAVFDTTGVRLSVTSNLAAGSSFSSGPQAVTIPSFTTSSSGGSVIVASLIGSAGTMPQLWSGPNANTGLTFGQDGTAGYPYFTYGTGLTAMPTSLTLNSTNCIIGAPGVSAVLIGLN